MAWTNRPVSIWCLSALVVAFIGFGVAEHSSKAETLSARTFTALCRSICNLALGIGIAAAIGWIVQIALNLYRDRTSPDAVLSIESDLYDFSQAVEQLLSPRAIALAFGASLVLAVILNTWAPLRWSNRAKTWLSWVSAILVGAISISFVSVQEGVAREQFTLGPIRASIGTDLTQLRDARRRRIAAQWLVAEMVQDLPRWQRYARKGTEVCPILNERYRLSYRDEAARAGLPPYDQQPSKLPCDSVAFAVFVAKAVAVQTPAPAPSTSQVWMSDEKALWGGDPDPDSVDTGSDDVMMEDDSEGATTAPAASKLSTAAQALNIRAAKEGQARVGKEAKEESDAATAWETVASAFLATTGGEADPDFRGALVKAWIDFIAERIVGESGDLIAERLATDVTVVKTPREALMKLAGLPKTAFPLKAGAALANVKALRSTFGAALELYLPDGDLTDKLAILASTTIAKERAEHTRKPAEIHNSAGEVIGTVTPPPTYDLGFGHGPGPAPHIDPPHPEFHGMP